MFSPQDSKCQYCGRVSKLYLDHCHATGAYRGHICPMCNSSIGLLGDSAEGVRKALEYLERNGSASAGVPGPPDGLGGEFVVALRLLEVQNVSPPLVFARYLMAVYIHTHIYICVYIYICVVIICHHSIVSPSSFHYRSVIDPSPIHHRSNTNQSYIFVSSPTQQQSTITTPSFRQHHHLITIAIWVAPFGNT